MKLTVVNSKEPIEDRIEKLVDSYFKLFKQYPKLPMFVMRGIERDVDYLLNTLMEIKDDKFLEHIKNNIALAMNEGKIKKMPLIYIVYTLYGLMIMPFLTKKATIKIFLGNEANFDRLIIGWKPIIVSQLTHLLEIDHK